MTASNILDVRKAIIDAMVSDGISVADMARLMNTTPEKFLSVLNSDDMFVGTAPAMFAALRLKWPEGAR